MGNWGSGDKLNKFSHLILTSVIKLHHFIMTEKYFQKKMLTLCVCKQKLLVDVWISAMIV